MAIQTDEYGQPVLDDQGNPVQITAPAAPAAPSAAPPAAGPMLVNRGGQQYQGTPVQPPAGQGRMYMGPALSQSDESAFMLSPAGTRVNAVPPPTPDQTAGAAGRVAAGTGAESNEAALGRLRSVDAPGSRTLGVMNAPAPDPTDEVMALAQKMGVPLNQATAAVEAQKRYQAQRGYHADLAKGMSATDAMTKWGPLLLGSKSAMTPYQQSQTKMRQQQLDQQAAKANRILPPKATPAVVMQFKTILGAERQAAIDKDSAAANAARWEKAAFLKAHPELGMGGGGASPGTATGTTPAPMAAPAPGRPPVAMPATAAQGRPVKDKNGKTWVYTGTAADPKTDKNPAHWTAQ